MRKSVHYLRQAGKVKGFFPVQKLPHRVGGESFIYLIGDRDKSSLEQLFLLFDQKNSIKVNKEKEEGGKEGRRKDE